MLPDRLSNPGPLTYESGALPIALRGPASQLELRLTCQWFIYHKAKCKILVFQMLKRVLSSM